MARVLITGFEASPPTATDINSPDGYVFAGTAGTRDTTTKKSGASSLKLLAGATTAFANIPRSVATNSVSIAFWFLRTGTNSGTAPEVGIYGTALQARVSISSTGTITAYGGLSGTSSTSSAIAVDTWVHIELRVNVTSTTAGTIRLFVDRVEVGSSTSATWTAQSGTVFSLRMSAYATTGTVFYDDLVVDSEASTTAATIGCSQIALLKPVSDNIRGDWTGGVGGTTSLFDAVNNFPPIGIAAETDLTQIENNTAFNLVTSVDYVTLTESYSSVGVAGVIKSTMIIVCHGEDVSTGTKTGGASAEENPTDPGITFDYGGAGGALGTYPSGWAWSYKASATVPSNRSNGVKLSVGKTDTGTRVASVSALGLYAEYDLLAQSIGDNATGSATVSGYGPSQYVQFTTSSSDSVTLTGVTIGHVLIATGKTERSAGGGSVGIVNPTFSSSGWVYAATYDISTSNVNEGSGYVAVKIANNTSESIGISYTDGTQYSAIAELDLTFTGSIEIAQSGVHIAVVDDNFLGAEIATVGLTPSTTPYYMFSGAVGAEKAHPNIMELGASQYLGVILTGTDTSQQVVTATNPAGGA